MSIKRETLEADVLIIGAHQLSGAIMDPCGFRELVPDFENTAPLKTPVTSDALIVSPRAIRTDSPLVLLGAAACDQPGKVEQRY
jgi:hypothetical protein